jgi:hypothetical protein
MLGKVRSVLGAVYVVVKTKKGPDKPVKIQNSMWWYGQFQMFTIFLVSSFWWQFLQAMVGEIPNKHLSLVTAQKKHVFFLNMPCY